MSPVANGLVPEDIHNHTMSPPDQMHTEDIEATVPESETAKPLPKAETRLDDLSHVEEVTKQIVENTNDDVPTALHFTENIDTTIRDADAQARAGLSALESALILRQKAQLQPKPKKPRMTEAMKLRNLPQAMAELQRRGILPVQSKLATKLRTMDIAVESLAENHDNRATGNTLTAIESSENEPLFVYPIVGNDSTSAAAGDLSVSEQARPHRSINNADLEMAGAEDSEDDIADHAYHELKRAYKAKKRAGTDNIVDQVEFMVAKRDNDRRAAKRKREGEADSTDDDEQLSPHPRSHLLERAQAGIARAKLDEATREELRTAELKPGKKPRYRSRKLDTHITRGPKSKKRDRNTASKLRREKEGGSKAMPLPNLANLFGENTLETARANEGKGEQPTFGGHDRTAALKDLLASIPDEGRQEYRDDVKILQKAAGNFATIKRIVVGDGGFRLKGMVNSLRNHQLLGTSWMRDQERRASVPFGGLVADDMGLGKTVVSLQLETP
jgi:hypothetical protein